MRISLNTSLPFEETVKQIEAIACAQTVIDDILDNLDYNDDSGRYIFIGSIHLSKERISKLKNFVGE